MLKMRHWFKDEFDQETETMKTYTVDMAMESELGGIALQVGTFIQHLKNCEYTDELIKEGLQNALQCMSGEQKELVGRTNS